MKKTTKPLQLHVTKLHPTHRQHISKKNKLNSKYVELMKSHNSDDNKQRQQQQTKIINIAIDEVSIESQITVQHRYDGQSI